MTLPYWSAASSKDSSLAISPSCRNSSSYPAAQRTSSENSGCASTNASTALETAARTTESCCSANAVTMPPQELLNDEALCELNGNNCGGMRSEMPPFLPRLAVMFRTNEVRDPSNYGVTGVVPK